MTIIRPSRPIEKIINILTLGGISHHIHDQINEILMRSSDENILQSYNKSVSQDGMKCLVRRCLCELTGDLPLD